MDVRVHIGKSRGRSTPQSSIDPLDTTTLNMFICTTSYWQIYWQIYPPTIEHRSLECHYTKYFDVTKNGIFFLLLKLNRQIKWQIYPILLLPSLLEVKNGDYTFLLL